MPPFFPHWPPLPHTNLSSLPHPHIVSLEQGNNGLVFTIRVILLMGIWKLLFIYCWNHIILTVTSFTSNHHKTSVIFYLWPSLATYLKYDISAFTKCPLGKVYFLILSILFKQDVLWHVWSSKELSLLPIHFTFYTHHHEYFRSFPCISTFYKEVEPEHDLLFVSFVSPAGWV